jgi:hypothetical protein
MSLLYFQVRKDYLFSDGEEKMEKEPPVSSATRFNRFMGCQIDQLIPTYGEKNLPVPVRFTLKTEE